MLMSKSIGKTAKKIEDEFNLESQKLILRSGLFRNISPGIYSVLPQGKMAIDNLLNLLSNELEREGFQNISIPLEIDFERAASLTLRNDMKSYKDLPKAVYDICTIEREKIKVKEGILKSKSFVGLRTIGFYENEELLLDSYRNMRELYISKFKEIGLDILNLKAYNHQNSASDSEELIFVCENGDREIFACEKCGYRELKEMANYYVEECEMNDEAVEPVHTPDIKTIKELEEFMNIDAGDLAKTLLIKAGKEIVAVVIRGNRELNLYKLSTVLGVSVEDIEMADYKDIDGNIETVPGFVGPMELESVRLIVDSEITKIGSLITGANKRDYHLRNVKYNRDFVGDLVVDVAYIKEGDRCPVCGESLKKEYGIDIGEILSLGKITNVNNMQYKNKEGKPQSIYGVSSHMDIYRLLSIIVEKYHDDNGIIWPVQIAPYQVIVSILNVKKEAQVELGRKLYNELREKNIHVLLDDRNERAGAKFYDADLLGIPIRIVAARGASENRVEFKLRWESEKEELNSNEAIEKVLNLIKY